MRSRPAPRRRGAPGSRSASPTTACYADYAAMAKAEAARGRRHRGGRHRHAEPPARAGGRGVPEGRHPRHLRQAAGDDAAKEAKPARGAGREAPSACSPSPTTTPATRWCARRGSWCRTALLGEIRVVQVEYAAGLADRVAREPPARSRPSGAPTRRARARAAASATSARMRSSSPATSPGSRSASSAPSSAPSSPAGASTTTSQVLLRFGNGARGALWASQVAPGNENNLRLRVYGSRAGLEWRQEQPNQLQWSPFGQPTQTISRATGAAGAAAARVSRIPAGHPEGYLEAFATLYGEIAQAIRAARPGGAEGRSGGPVSRARRRSPRRRVHRGGGRLFGPGRSLGSPRPR